MSFTARLRAARTTARARRDFQRAVTGASPALRNELLTMAQAQNRVTLR